MGTTRKTITLTDQQDEWIKARIASGDFTNDSEYIRDLIRGQLVKEQWDRNEQVVGAITLVYDHHVPGLSEKLTHLQHHKHANILATTHVHMDSHICAEVILVTIEKGGHVWPGGKNLLPRFVVGKDVGGVDANDMIWEFFSRHSLP